MPSLALLSCTVLLGAIHEHDAAAELARLKHESKMARAKRGVASSEVLECGCGFGHTCEAHRASREEEVFEGFADDQFEGFGVVDDSGPEYYNLHEVYVVGIFNECILQFGDII